MRLNLTRFHCVSFHLFSNFIVPSDKDLEIDSLMNQTHTHDLADEQEGDHKTSLFGSRSKIGELTYRVQGRLTKAAHLSGLEIDLSVSSNRSFRDLSLPPKSFRPVSLLVGASSGLFGPINVSFHATFEYDQQLGYKSKVSFPIPLVMQDAANGITHIESAEFSRRDNDELEYEVMVMSPADSSVFTHIVSLDSTMELSLPAIRRLLDKTRSISAKLLF